LIKKKQSTTESLDSIQTIKNRECRKPFAFSEEQHAYYEIIQQSEKEYQCTVLDYIEQVIVANPGNETAEYFISTCN
jgi:phosphoenolpyruvate carboxylase